MKFCYVLLLLCLLIVMLLLVVMCGLDVCDMIVLDWVLVLLLIVDGGKVVFVKCVVGIDSKVSIGLYICDLCICDVVLLKLLILVGWNVNFVVLFGDGQIVYFLSVKGGSQQLYVMLIVGGMLCQFIDFLVDVDSYYVFLQGDCVVFSSGVFQVCGLDLVCISRKLDVYKVCKNIGEVFDSLFVCYWDIWNDGCCNMLFVVLLLVVKGVVVKGVLVISVMFDGDVLFKLFGGNDDFIWFLDGMIVVVVICVVGKQELWLINFDLYCFDVDGKQVLVNFIVVNLVWDVGLVFSDDGKILYYCVMKCLGFEVDCFGLMVMDVVIGKICEIVLKWDCLVGEIVLFGDGKGIYILVDDMGEYCLFLVDIDSGEVVVIVEGGSIGLLICGGMILVYICNSFKSGDQIVVVVFDGVNECEIILSVGQMLFDVVFGDYEQFQFKGWNNEIVYGYVVKLYNYQEGKIYLVVFLIYGGLQGSFGNGWSYCWNLQIYVG